MARILTAYLNEKPAGSRTTPRPYTHAVVELHQDGTAAVVSWHTRADLASKALAEKVTPEGLRAMYRKGVADSADSPNSRAWYERRLAWAETLTGWAVTADVRVRETTPVDPAKAEARKAAAAKGRQTKRANNMAAWYLSDARRRLQVEEEAHLENEAHDLRAAGLEREAQVVEDAPRYRNLARRAECHRPLAQGTGIAQRILRTHEQVLAAFEALHEEALAMDALVVNEETLRDELERTDRERLGYARCFPGTPRGWAMLEDFAAQDEAIKAAVAARAEDEEATRDELLHGIVEDGDGGMAAWLTGQPGAGLPTSTVVVDEEEEAERQERALADQVAEHVASQDWAEAEAAERAERDAEDRAALTEQQEAEDRRFRLSDQVDEEEAAGFRALTEDADPFGPEARERLARSRAESERLGGLQGELEDPGQEALDRLNARLLADRDRARVAFDSVGDWYYMAAQLPGMVEYKGPQDGREPEPGELNETTLYQGGRPVGCLDWDTRTGWILAEVLPADPLETMRRVREAGR